MTDPAGAVSEVTLTEMRDRFRNSARPDKRQYAEIFDELLRVRQQLVEMRGLLNEARPIVFEDHMREIGTRLLKPGTLTARIDRALSSTERKEARKFVGVNPRTGEAQWQHIPPWQTAPPAQTPQTQGKCENEECEDGMVPDPDACWKPCPDCTARTPAAEPLRKPDAVEWRTIGDTTTYTPKWQLPNGRFTCEPQPAAQPAAERDIYECLCGAKVRKGKDMREHDCSAAEREGEDDLHRAIVAYGNSQYDLAINNDPERLPILRERAKRSYDGLRALLGGSRE